MYLRYKKNGTKTFARTSHLIGSLSRFTENRHLYVVCKKYKLWCYKNLLMTHFLVFFYIVYKYNRFGVKLKLNVRT